MWRRERGSVAPLLAVLVVAAGAAALGLGKIGGAAVARAQARTAADAAALAGAVDGKEAARAMASANGARLVAYADEGNDTSVAVVLGRARASARARRESGRRWLSSAPGPLAARRGDGLAPATLAALARAEQILGRPVPITSGYRSPAEQAALWARRASNPYPVAEPGTSMHERGLAIDVPLGFVPMLAAIAPDVGLCHPYPVADPVHFEACGHR